MESFSPTEDRTQVENSVRLHGHGDGMHGKLSMPKLKRALRDLPADLVKPPPSGRKASYIKQWRNFRKVTQAALAEAVGMSNGNLSNIENGKQPYIQDHLEAIARILRCEVADLILRNPQEPEGIWSLWDRAKSEQKQQILKIVRALLAP